MLANSTATAMMYSRADLNTNLRHYRPSIVILDVSERHLRALVPVDLDLRMVDKRDLLDGYYAL